MLKKRVETTEVVNLQASRIDERIDYDRLSSEKQRVVDLLVEQYVANKKPAAAAYNISKEEFAAMDGIARTRYAQLLSGTSGYTKVNIQHAEGSAAILMALVADSVAGTPLSDVRVILMDQYGQLLKISQTNEEGRVRFTGVSGGNYLLRLDRSVSSLRHAKLSDIHVEQPQVHTALRLENIYFDFDHYKLRPEARLALDQLAEYLLKTPGAQLELFAFADDVGTTEYNLKLSQKRGESVAQYLLKKGVDQTSMAIVAKGKQDTRELDVEWQRQYNRRVEFNLNGASLDFKESARTGILRKTVDLKSLAQQAGTSPETLGDLNGISGDVMLKAFQPVRLPAEKSANVGGLVVFD